MGGSVELDVSDGRTRFTLVLPASRTRCRFHAKTNAVEEPLATVSRMAAPGSLPSVIVVAAVLGSGAALGIGKGAGWL